ncbi:ferredoxin [Streptomyces sp. CB03238]|uniref:ferredoxin n=1 Tax=Streptomyces sp. CB03238 TaxID=1907777 RepID=UPI000A111B9A|nr:ferredoxin [Streptomyces sp. CB03238]ORT56544.1 cytochrome [Streptomyces sp. CB03238]
MSEKRWSVDADRAACAGSGMCVGTAPEHFRMEDGKALALAETVDPDDAVIDAAEVCPVEAITVRELATGKVLAPEV